MTETTPTNYAPTYRRNEDGRLEETSASIRRNIAATFGFQYRRIVLLEANYMTIEGSEESLTYCASVAFSVNGMGYWTNFDHISRAEAYDA